MEHIILGDGAYGIVFSTDNIHARKQTPIKELTWVKEVAIANYIKSPNVVEFLSVDYFKGSDLKKRGRKTHNIYIKMKMYKCLSNIVVNKDVGICTIIKDIASALAHCHKKKILHRDVKECNILVEFKKKKLFRAYLSDFGLSLPNIMQGDLSPHVVTATHRPPEIPDVEDYDYRLDTWGFGMIVVFLMTGEDFMKFTDMTTKEFTRLTKDRGKFLETLQRFINKHGHADLQRTEFYGSLINKCLKKYDQRPTMTEINDYIKTTLGATLKPGTAPAPTSPSLSELSDRQLECRESVDFQPRFFNPVEWQTMESIVYFANPERPELFYLTRLFTNQYEKTIFSTCPDVELAYISTFMILEHSLTDYPTGSELYQKIFSKAGVKFDFLTVSKMIYKIFQIFNFDIIEMVKNALPYFTGEVRRKNLDQTLCALPDSPVDC